MSCAFFGDSSTRRRQAAWKTHEQNIRKTSADFGLRRDRKVVGGELFYIELSSLPVGNQ